MLTTTSPTAGAIRFRSRGDLRAAGWGPRAITAAVRAGVLVRARGGVYLPPEVEPAVISAARVGGRLTCVSELARLGVFVLSAADTHVHLAPNAARLRPVATRVRLHWERLVRAPHPRSCCVEPVDAVICAVRCQEPRAAVASLDSAVRLGVIRSDELGEVFDALPRRYRVLERLVDPRSESGPESFVRLMLRRLGCAFRLQVRIDTVGRVDFVVDGWLIIECDSAAHHGGWDARRRDLRRDQAAAALGYTTFRPFAEDIMWNPHVVFAALRGLTQDRRRSEFRRRADRVAGRPRGARVLPEF